MLGELQSIHTPTQPQYTLAMVVTTLVIHTLITFEIVLSHTMNYRVEDSGILVSVNDERNLMQTRCTILLTS